MTAIVIILLFNFYVNTSNLLFVQNWSYNRYMAGHENQWKAMENNLYCFLLILTKVQMRTIQDPFHPNAKKKRIARIFSYPFPVTINSCSRKLVHEFLRNKTCKWKWMPEIDSYQCQKAIIWSQYLLALRFLCSIKRLYYKVFAASCSIIPLCR